MGRFEIMHSRSNLCSRRNGFSLLVILPLSTLNQFSNQFLYFGEQGDNQLLLDWQPTTSRAYNHAGQAFGRIRMRWRTFITTNPVKGYIPVCRLCRDCRQALQEGGIFIKGLAKGIS